jgi:3-oxoadipate enol-lactonase
MKRNPLLAALPLMRAVPAPIPLVVNEDASSPGAQEVNRRLALFSKSLGTSPFVAADTSAPNNALHIAIATSMAAGGGLAAISSHSPPESLHELIASLRSHESVTKRAGVGASDGVRINTYLRGEHREKPIVVVSPLGMPAELMFHWGEFLCSRFKVLTIEMRGLFEQESSEFVDMSVQAQAADIVDAMNAHALVGCHLMGFCGSAVAAMLAAQSPRVVSLSLWHGVFELGTLAPKTAHQKDFIAMIEIGARNAKSAEEVRRAMVSPRVLTGMTPQLAPLLLYPYCRASVFERYCRGASSIMTADCARIAVAVGRPTVVVTSESDRTTHAAGSAVISSLIAGARLEVTHLAAHLELFAAPTPLRELAAAILRG